MSIFRRLVTTVAVVASVAAVTVTAQTQINLTGKWTFSVITENGTGTPTVVLKQEGEKLTGTYESARMGVRPLEGTVKKDSINFALTGGEVALRFVGKIVDKDNLAGALDMGGMGSAAFTAERQK